MEEQNKIADNELKKVEDTRLIDNKNRISTIDTQIDFNKEKIKAMNSLEEDYTALNRNLTQLVELLKKSIKGPKETKKYEAMLDDCRLSYRKMMGMIDDGRTQTNKDLKEVYEKKDSLEKEQKEIYRKIEEEDRKRREASNEEKKEENVETTKPIETNELR